MTPSETGRPPLDRPPLDRSALAAAGDHWRVEVVDEAGSTNALVADRARAGESEGLVVVAEHQTAGRGRMGRSWETPARAALTFSVLVRPQVDASRWPWLPLLTGIAVADGVHRSTGLSCVLKWPNDVLVDGKKLAGILLERIESPTGPAAVLGVGINVSTTEAELPVPTATSVSLAGVPDPDRTGLLVEVVHELARVYRGWADAGGDPAGLHDEYESRCETLTQVVEVTLPSGETLTGRAVGIDPEGRLDVETDGGRTSIGAGDVMHLRPA